MVRVSPILLLLGEKRRGRTGESGTPSGQSDTNDVISREVEYTGESDGESESEGGGDEG